METPRMWWPMMLLLLLVTGCQSVPTSQVQDFVSATNALAQAESNYFDQLQAASDQSHVLIASAIYVAHGQDFPTIATELTKRDDFSKAKALRMAAMAQLQNYAQQLSAITTAATGTWIADDANSTSTEVTKLLTDQKAAKVTQQQAGLIQTGVNKLAAAIISPDYARPGPNRRKRRRYGGFINRCAARAGNGDRHQKRAISACCQRPSAARA